MICTVFDVKMSYGQFDGISPDIPDVTFDSSMGYYIGFRLLVEDGSSWICRDATLGAALWEIYSNKDLEIQEGCRAMTEMVIKYCDNTFPAEKGQYGSDAIAFDAGGVLTDGDSGLDIYYPGDTVYIAGSLRNDGYYDVEISSDSSITLLPEFSLVGADEGAVYLMASSFPAGLRRIAAGMVAFDVWSRTSNGLTSESIGSYSYSKDTVSIEGLGYPKDVTAGILLYKRPKIR